MAAPGELPRDDVDGAPALLCAECENVLVLESHLLDSRIEQGDGRGAPRPLELFGREFPCYEILVDADERYSLIRAQQEQKRLPSKNGWIVNPLALGQGLEMSESLGWPKRQPSTDELERAWFKGYHERAAHCAKCKADVAFLFEPDSIFFLTYVGTQASGKGNGDAFGMVPFWGVQAAKVRCRCSQPSASANDQSADVAVAAEANASPHLRRKSSLTPEMEKLLLQSGLLPER